MINLNGRDIEVSALKSAGSLRPDENWQPSCVFSNTPEGRETLLCYVQQAGTWVPWELRALVPGLMRLIIWYSAVC
jgi:hypothetical protein